MIMRVHIQSQAIKGKSARSGGQVTLHTPTTSKKTQVQKHPHCTMSADGTTPLFKVHDEDKVTYEDDPTVLQVRANLVVAEWVQQEKVKQMRLERE